MFPCGGGGGGKKKKPKKKKPTPSQLHFEAPLRTVATVFPSVYVAVLATRFGEPIARLPRETQHPVNPDFDDREFEDIPKELRDLDDKMTGGEMEYRELMVGVAMAVRVSRRFVATALDRPLLLKLREQAPPQIRAPLFQCVGATQGVWVYGVDGDHIVALMADGGHYAMDSRDRDARFAEVVETLRRAIKTAPPPPPLGPAPPSPLAEPVPLAAPSARTRTGRRGRRRRRRGRRGRGARHAHPPRRAGPAEGAGRVGEPLRHARPPAAAERLGGAQGRVLVEAAAQQGQGRRPLRRRVVPDVTRFLFLVCVVSLWNCEQEWS